MSVDKRVEQYVKLRDKKKEIEARHKEELKPYNEVLAKLEAVMMQTLLETGGDSIKTPHGTVYKSEKKSASLADPDAFMRFVIGGELYDLLDRKANVTAVEAFLAEHNELPPGVNFTVHATVNVRRK